MGRSNISKSSKIFDIINVLIMIFLALITFYPFWYEICVSFSNPIEAIKGGWFILPREFNFQAYLSVMGSKHITVAFSNSIFVTVAGTIIDVIVTCGLAYTVSKKFIPGQKILSVFILITMLFGGGIIPTYIVVKGLGLINSMWALILLSLAPAFSVIVMRNFFTSIPQELEESAFIDGANPFRIFFSIAIPISLPSIATIALWSSVGYWNDYFKGVMYLNDKSKYVLPVLLREIIQGVTQEQTDGRMLATSTQTVIAATIIVAVIPILCVYPFLQKYFTKGVMIGAVKG